MNTYTFKRIRIVHVGLTDQVKGQDGSAQIIKFGNLISPRVFNLNSQGSMCDQSDDPGVLISVFDKLTAN